MSGAQTAMTGTQRQDARKLKASEVYRSLIHGMTPSEIAAAKNMPVRTVAWYITEAARILQGDIKLLTSESLLRDMFAHHRERTRHLWVVVFTPKAPSIAKVAALKQLAEEDDRLLKLAERLGIIQPAPDLRTEHDIRITERKEYRLVAQVTYSDEQLATRFPDLVSRLR